MACDHHDFPDLCRHDNYIPNQIMRGEPPVPRADSNGDALQPMIFLLAGVTCKKEMITAHHHGCSVAAYLCHRTVPTVMNRRRNRHVSTSYLPELYFMNHKPARFYPHIALWLTTPSLSCAPLKFPARMYGTTRIRHVINPYWHCMT